MIVAVAVALLLASDVAVSVTVIAEDTLAGAVYVAPLALSSPSDPVLGLMLHETPLSPPFRIVVVNACDLPGSSVTLDGLRLIVTFSELPQPQMASRARARARPTVKQRGNPVNRDI